MRADNELQQINLTIEEAQKHIEKMEALDRLRSNKDFTLIIEQGYFVDQAAELVAAKCAPEMSSDEQQKAVDRLILGVGGFQQYLNKLYHLGNQSKRAMSDYYATRDEIMAETH